MRTVWTKADVKKLVRLWKKGTKIKEIHKEFPNRTAGSVTNKIYALQRSGELVSRHKDGSNPPKKTKSTKTGKPLSEDKYPPWKKTPYDSHEDIIPKDWIKNPWGDKYPVKKVQDNLEKMAKASKSWGESGDAIVSMIEEIKEFLLSKNTQYGDSALNPIRVFSKADKSEQLKVRIDDKLNRLMQGNASLESDEDVVKDLIGYLILLLIHLRE
tara:strand:+ start:173 stop:811 length:639 start_codon:yes stop_codon:yes gene_type:complete